MHIGGDGFVDVGQLLFARRKKRAPARLLRNLAKQRFAFERNAGHTANADDENRRLHLLAGAQRVRQFGRAVFVVAVGHENDDLAAFSSRETVR